MQPLRKLLFGIQILFLVVFGIGNASGEDSITIVDQEFSNSAWTTTVFTGGIGGFAFALQDENKGFPAPSRRIEITVLEPGPAAIRKSISINTKPFGFGWRN